MNILQHAVAVMLLCIVSVHGLSFYLPVNMKKCVKEEIHKDVLVTGDYELSDVPGQKTVLHVADSNGHTLYIKEDATKGKFAFTTDEFDVFEVCFHSKMIAGGRGADREVSLMLKKGVEAKTYDDIAKAEKLKPMEVELRRLEDLSESIVNDFAYMRSREEEMRDTNESTNSRVLYFAIFSMVCLLSLATWQVFYLRRYFKSKKLIE
ncbi:transmembrane emp24 domain-containing protein 10-like [Ptychodera flava]|uniref:transmembrane emp24 domain-containing protein 10-like n=1 Tax=Ptychodera flava TaxID=63121 RepID=UPI003969F0C0